MLCTFEIDKWLEIVKGNQSKPILTETSETTVKPVTNTSSLSSHLVNKETAEVSKKEKYDDSYLSYDFTWTANEERPNEFCVESGTVISKASLFLQSSKRI